MTDFVVTITDATSLAGIADARAKYNASLPKDDKGVAIDALATDAAYVSWVVTQAAVQWGDTKKQADGQAALTALRTGNKVPMQAILAAT